MSQGLTPAQAARLLEVMPAAQWVQVAAQLEAVLAHGHGQVTITVDKGHVRFVRAETSTPLAGAPQRGAARAVPVGGEKQNGL